MNTKGRALALLSVLAFPALAQEPAGTIRIQGNVMISSGGEFTTASDGQAVVPGQRLMVGDDSSATVNYARDCERSYTSAGVYTIAPARCDEGNREDGANGQGPPRGWATAGMILGTAVLGATALRQEDGIPADRPVSR